MNKETRIKKIAEILEKQPPYGSEGVLWHGHLEPMKSFEIPVEYLIYNKYNGRILSRTKTLESQGKKIDPESEVGKKIIETLLWESKENRNENTLKDLKQKTQLKVGIITRDGIVIDGNRRLMLLNRLKESHFRAIVLPVCLEDDPIEIERLETTYQMGEDEKLGYNPIEKYLKAKELFTKLTDKLPAEKAIEKIANWMGEDVSKITEWLEVVKVIDEYLEHFHYNGIYAMADTHNDGKEDLFLFLRKWINSYYDKESDKGFPGYTNLDVDDLKTIGFHYIRAKIGDSYDGKIFRNIADGARKSHFFGDKDIWASFTKRHFDLAVTAIDKIDTEHPIDYDSPNIEASLSHRDTKYRDLVISLFEKNIADHITSIRYKKEADKPVELVIEATKAIEAINPNHPNFSKPEVLNRVEGLVNKLMTLETRKGPEQTLSTALKLVQDVKIDPKVANLDKIRELLKEISKTSFNMAKEL